VLGWSREAVFMSRDQPGGVNRSKGQRSRLSRVKNKLLKKQPRKAGSMVP
jgi:hypothetical protein